MKATNFYWSWNDRKPQPDNMTRQRAAVLLRAWRHLLRQPSNHKPILSLKRVGPHAYRVAHFYCETGTLIIGDPT